MTHESSQRDEVLPPPGTRIDGRYLITGVLGEGGMGAVLAAEDLVQHQPVAIKLILPSRACDPGLVRRFVSEARVAGSLHHPNLTRVLAQGWLGGGQPYMVLEFLTGGTLDELIQPGQTFPNDLAIDFVLQVCEGVAEAHARGIVHRDLKPSNLFVTYDEQGAPWIKVLDFGISKIGDRGVATQGSELTKSDAFLGSPMYMSPEQLRCSKSVDGRTDVWALGIILHRLLSGRLPFEARNIASQMALVLAEPPVALRTHAPNAPESLERIVARCLQRELRRRYQDVGQLALELAAASRDPLARLRAQRVVACLTRAGAQAPVGPRGEALLRRSPHPDALDAEPATRVEQVATGTLTESLDGIIVRFDPPPRRGMRLVAAAAALVAAVGLYRASLPAADMVEGRLGSAIRPLAAAVRWSVPATPPSVPPLRASRSEPTPSASAARATRALPHRRPTPRGAKRAAISQDTTRLGPLEPSL